MVEFGLGLELGEESMYVVLVWVKVVIFFFFSVGWDF